MNDISRGWTAVVNESLVSAVLSMGCLVVGTATGIVGVGWMYMTMECSKMEAHATDAQCGKISR
jgi:hypothetical protein